MRIFKRRPKPPLEEAVILIRKAIEIALKYERDARYKPTHEDLELFAQIARVFLECQKTSQYIEARMCQKYEGKINRTRLWRR